MSFLADETGGKSYPVHKYCLDNTERPTIDYDKTTTWLKLGETDTTRRGYILLKPLCQQLADQDVPIISYFLDGSRRVFKVGDVAYSADGSKRNTLYPVIAGQIGIGCCKRVDKKMRCEKLRKEIVLAVPDIADADGKDGFFPSLSQKITRGCEVLARYGLEMSAVYPYRTAKEEKKFEDKGTAKIQDRMMFCEKVMVAELVREGKLGQNDYLIKDGSLEYRPTMEDRQDSRRYKIFKNNYRWVIGLSKSFNPELCHDIGGKANPGFIADLPLYARTPVAIFDCSEQKDNPLGDIQFAVWYIRIREQRRTRSPFDGILKVEKILIDENERLDSEQIDVLSAHIINERIPTCYGSDLRWANHIYPVYLTELFVKSQYIGEQSFLHLF
jgi:hypothetical protein